MATTVTLDSEIVQAIQQATKQKDKTSAVHMALKYLRLQKLRQLASLAGTVELRYSNDELETMEEC
jgi:Arc/MetJ family transcription regulator